MTEQGSGIGKREHRYVSDRLSAYIDGELPARERARVETHLAACEGCRADLHTLRWTKGLLQQVPTAKVPRSFVVRAADVEARRPTRRRVSLFATQWATAVVALLLIVVVGGDLLIGAQMRVAQRSAAPQAVSDELAVAETPVSVQEKVVVKEVEAEVVEGEMPPAPRAEMGQTVPVDTPAPDTSLRETAPEAQVERMEAADAVTITPFPGVMMLQRKIPAAATATPAAAEPESEAEVGVRTEAPQAKRDEQVSGEGGEPAEEPSRPEHTVTPTVSAIDEAPPVVMTYQEEGVLARDGVRLAWRVAEIALAAALVGLLVTVFWLRRRG